MKTINLELVLPDFNDDLNIKICVRKGGGVEVQTLPPQVQKQSGSEEEPTEEKISKKSSTPKKKKISGNMMDLDSYL